ncbi:MAG TPA: hypothetical protein VN457_00845 [Chlamydiales bacterium]|nr:hypothetical protein [Chlamydiales bacterium]
MASETQQALQSIHNLYTSLEGSAGASINMNTLDNNANEPIVQSIASRVLLNASTDPTKPLIFTAKPHYSGFYKFLLLISTPIRWLFSCQTKQQTHYSDAIAATKALFGKIDPQQLTLTDIQKIERLEHLVNAISVHVEGHATELITDASKRVLDARKRELAQPARPIPVADIARTAPNAPSKPLHALPITIAPVATVAPLVDKEPLSLEDVTLDKLPEAIQAKVDEIKNDLRNLQIPSLEEIQLKPKATRPAPEYRGPDMRDATVVLHPEKFAALYPELHDKGYKALHFACRYGHTALARELLNTLSDKELMAPIHKEPEDQGGQQ